MLTQPSEIQAAAARLCRLGMPEPIARSVVADTLGLPGWDQAIASAHAGTLTYDDTWLAAAAGRFQDAVTAYLKRLQGMPEDLPIPSILDIFVTESPLSAQDLASLPEADAIRRVVAVCAPCQLVLTPPGSGVSGTRRTAERVDGPIRYVFEVERIELAQKARLRADLWSVTAHQAQGPVAVMTGVLYTPLDRKGIAGEKALLAIDPEMPEMISELLSIVGSFPKGQIPGPVSSVDYLYVVPRARGQRMHHALVDVAATQLQRVSPAFGEFRVDPYLLIEPLQFPAGMARPSTEALRHHLEQQLLIPLSHVIQRRRVGIRQRGTHLPLTPKQALVLLGELDHGRKLAEITIPSAAELSRLPIRTSPMGAQASLQS